MKTVKEKIESGREYRDLQEFSPEDDYIVEGYASTFNEPYTLYRDGEYIFREQVDPEAFANTDMSDVIFQYDHEGRVFARKSNDTLSVTTDEHGLKIRAYLGGTEMGKQLYEEIRGGYTSKMSFGFIVGRDKTEVKEMETGEVEILRTLLDISKLFDCSAVSLPANDATSISARSIGEGVVSEAKKEIQAMREKRERIERIKSKIGE